MGKFVVIVLDGFGVGAMPDVPQVRPADCGANTCIHIFERTPDLKLPNLAGNAFFRWNSAPASQPQEWRPEPERREREPPGQQAQPGPASRASQQPGSPEP